MNLSLPSVLTLAVLVLIQAAAAVPWVLVLLAGGAARPGARRSAAPPWLKPLAGVLVAAVVAPAVLLVFVQERESLETVGQLYGAALQLQLIADLFILTFVFLLAVWPKGAAVALAAFREGVRQPMFWLLFLIAFALMTISPFVPYFTFGEDHIMVKELGYDTIMLFAVAFGVLAAGLSISEEIEGRTAVTLMSKPVSRRQFLLGKFAGILLASLVMIALLGTYFEGVQLYKRWFDKLDPEPPPVWVTRAVEAARLPGEAGDVVRGALFWANNTLETAPGLVLNLSQVMVLVAIAVSLATRLPMVVNLSTVLVIFVLAHLAPVLDQIGRSARERRPGPVSDMLAFMARLFDTTLPALDLFRVGPVLVTETPLATPQFFAYVGQVAVYAVLYTAIVLLFGLILFEDRDLA